MIGWLFRRKKAEAKPRQPIWESKTCPACESRYVVPFGYPQSQCDDCNQYRRQLLAYAAWDRRIAYFKEHPPIP